MDIENLLRLIVLIHPAKMEGAIETWPDFGEELVNILRNDSGLVRVSSSLGGTMCSASESRRYAFRRAVPPELLANASAVLVRARGRP